MLIRCFVETSRSAHIVELGKLSEGDVHFFAGILHLFPSIPFCHLHIVVPVDPPGVSDMGDVDVWGDSDAAGDSRPSQVQISNHSPFPAPAAASASVAKSIQSHMELAKKLFETCPISTQLRLSICPLIPGAEDLIAAGDATVLAPTIQGGGHAGTFNEVQKRLMDRALKGKKAKKQEAPVVAAGPRRALYVNNINSQRLHDCFPRL